MSADRIVKITDGAYFVKSYSVQTITPAFQVWGTVQCVGAADELQSDPSDQDYVVGSDEEHGDNFVHVLTK